MWINEDKKMKREIQKLESLKQEASILHEEAQARLNGLKELQARSKISCFLLKNTKQIIYCITLYNHYAAGSPRGRRRRRGRLEGSGPLII